MRYIVAGLALMFAVALFVNSSVDAGGDAKYTIKEVMKKGHGSGLLKKVLGGSASEEEKKQLVDLYESLAKNKPPKGDAKAWSTRAEQILGAAKGVAKGEAGAVDTLKKATNCANCHKEHK
jgi:hypothetical protein